MDMLVFVCILFIIGVVTLGMLAVFGIISTRFKKHLDDQVYMAIITKRLVNVIFDIKRMLQSGLLEKYPTIAAYLKQSFVAYDVGVFCLSNINVTTINRAVHDGFDFAQFVHEVCAAPEEVVNIVNKFNTTLDFWYSIEHPLRYRWLKFKKKIVLQILRILVGRRKARWVNECRQEKIQTETFLIEPLGAVV